MDKYPLKLTPMAKLRDRAASAGGGACDAPHTEPDERN